MEQWKGTPDCPTRSDTLSLVSSGAPIRRRGRAGPDAGTGAQLGRRKRGGQNPAAAGSILRAPAQGAPAPGPLCDLSAWHELLHPEEALRCKRESTAWGSRLSPLSGSHTASPSPTRAGRLAGVQRPRRSAQRLQVDALRVGQHFQEGGLCIETREPPGPQ